MTPKDHIELIQLETQLIRARLQLKAAIAYRKKHRRTFEEWEASTLMVRCCQVQVQARKDAIVMFNWEASHAD